MKPLNLLYIQGFFVESERIELSSKQVIKGLSTRLFCSCFFDYKLVTDNLLTTYLLKFQTQIEALHVLY